jgi:hypothetical protein
LRTAAISGDGFDDICHGVGTVVLVINGEVYINFT